MNLFYEFNIGLLFLFHKFNVLFLINGFAQKERLKIYNKGIISDNKANLRPVTFAKLPISNGPIAPPTMPEHKIPANEP